MEDRISYGNKQVESFSVYKFEPDPVSRNQTRLTVWKNLTSPKAYKLIPANYGISDDAKIKSKDYYMIINLKNPGPYNCACLNCCFIKAKPVSERDNFIMH